MVLGCMDQGKQNGRQQAGIDIPPIFFGPCQGNCSSNSKMPQKPRIAAFGSLNNANLAHGQPSMARKRTLGSCIQSKKRFLNAWSTFVKVSAICKLVGTHLHDITVERIL